MSERSSTTGPVAWFVAVLAILATIVGGIVFVQSIPVSGWSSANRAPAVDDPQLPSTLRPRGVMLTATAGEVTIERSIPAAGFGVREGETLDGRLPAGAFKADLKIALRPQGVRRAALGARIEGGTLKISYNDTVIASGASSDEAIDIWSSDVALGVTPGSLLYSFEGSGNGPATLQALWRPEDSAIALPLPTDDSGWVRRDRVLQGLTLVQTYGCASCHVPDNEQLKTVIDVSPAPILGNVGGRASAAWLRRWLDNPHEVNSASTMPAVLTEGADRDATIDDLVQFLVSMGGPSSVGGETLDDNMVTTGMVTYHRVGCVACHGPLEPLDTLPGRRTAAGQVRDTYTPLTQITGKMNRAALAAFLKDPVAVRPSGRMPAMALTDLEADAIASYLLTKLGDAAPGTGHSEFMLDPDRVERGRKWFVMNRCSTCHSLGPNRTALEANPSSMSFESMAASARPGCLADAPDDRADGTVDYRLTRAERKSIEAYLATVGERITFDVPHDRLVSTMNRLNCMACHSYAGRGGPERAITGYFETLGETQLGDEGRLPPSLSHVGEKLNTQWVREILSHGGTSRPYVATRMPQFGGAVVDAMPEDFLAAVGHASGRDDGPPMPEDYASIGRHLVGVGGLNCITCHTIAGRDSIGTPGPDLAQMAGRVRYDYFVKLLRDPPGLRPGLLMTSYFSQGAALAPQLGGDRDRQINALWAYLSQGEMLPMPDGLPDRGGFTLKVVDEPLVFRTFMADAGIRAIACGYPEAIHCAFDAAESKLTIIWEGEFLNAQGAWGGRGGSNTNPDQVKVWTAPRGPSFVVADTPPQEWPTSVEAAAVRFRGYELDDERRPIFLYDLNGEAGAIRVTEQPLPRRVGDRASLVRRFTLTGPANAVVWFNAGDAELIDSSAEVGGIAGKTPEGLLIVPLDESGRVAFDVEVSW